MKTPTKEVSIAPAQKTELSNGFQGRGFVMFSFLINFLAILWGLQDLSFGPGIDLNLDLQQCKDKVPDTGPSRNSLREVFQDQVRTAGACDFLLVVRG